MVVEVVIVVVVVMVVGCLMSRRSPNKEPSDVHHFSNGTAACVALVVVGGVVGRLLKGATPGPRKQTSAGQGLINISVITETSESWEGRCAGVSS